MFVAFVDFLSPELWEGKTECVLHLRTDQHVFPVDPDDLPVVRGEGDGEEEGGDDRADGGEAQGHGAAESHLDSILFFSSFLIICIGGIRAWRAFSYYFLLPLLSIRATRYLRPPSSPLYLFT